jgi:predicted ferric reductase
MSSASPLRAAIESSVSQPGQWAGPALVIALVALLFATALPIGKTAAIGWLAWIAFAVSLVLTARLPGLAARFGGLDHQYAWHHMLGLAAYVLALAHPFAVAWPWLATGDFGTVLRVDLAPSDRLARARAAAAAARGDLLGAYRLPAVAGLAPDHSARIRFRCVACGDDAGLGHARLVGDRADRRGCAGVPGLGLSPRRRRRYASAVSNIQPTPASWNSSRSTARRREAGPVCVRRFHSGRAYQLQRYHPFTVSAIRGGRLTLTIKAFGDCTLEMQRLSTGLAARVEGPFGACFETATATTPQLWIAGGIGVTPFLAQLEKLGPDVDIKLAYLFRAGHDALHIDELIAAAEARPGLELVTFITGTDLERLWQWLDSIGALDTREVYVCGPPPLLDAVVEQQNARGVSGPHNHIERFDFR